MNKRRIESKLVDRKTSNASLRTLSAQTLAEVVGGDGYLRYQFEHIIIGGY